jgi:CYTH domain-containing protein
MPTEHEFKLVVDPVKMATALLNAPCEVLQKRTIEQGYILDEVGSTTGVRIRRITESNGACHYLYTYKTYHNRVIEIETTLNPEDGRDLWEKTRNRLQKKRITVAETFWTPISDFGERKELLNWEIDFFYRGDELYLGIVEIERNPGEDRPKTPDWFKDAVIYEVPLTDHRFQNTRLGSVEYVKELLKTL